MDNEYDVWAAGPDLDRRLATAIGVMLADLGPSDRVEFDRICTAEPGTCRFHDVGDGWLQVTVGADAQLVLGTIHRGMFAARFDADGRDLN